MYGLYASRLKGGVEMKAQACEHNGVLLRSCPLRVVSLLSVLSILAVASCGGGDGGGGFATQSDAGPSAWCPTAGSSR
jgi:hypothetical protein